MEQAKPQLLLLQGQEKTDFSAASFLRTTGNETAWHSLDELATNCAGNKGINGLVLVGEAGSGKSHLATIWQDRVAALTLKPENLSLNALADLTAKYRFFVIDPWSDDWGNGVNAENFFHFLGVLAEWGRVARPDNSGYGLLITATAPPINWAVTLPDLASRLRALPMVPLSPPTSGDLAALLAKIFHDRQIRVSPEIITYILSHCERSPASLRQLVTDIDQISFQRKKPITVPMLRDYLQSMQSRDLFGGE